MGNRLREKAQDDLVEKRRKENKYLLLKQTNKQTKQEDPP